MSLAHYRHVLGFPGVKPLLLGGFLNRIGFAAMVLSIVLYIRFELGFGYQDAALAGGLFVVGFALGSTLWGRMIDRSGLRPVLAITSVAMAIFWPSLVFLPYPVLVGAAFFGGLFNLPVLVVTRHPLAALVPADCHRAAYSLESALVEITFIIGPAIAAAMVAAGSADVMLIAIGVWAPLTGAFLWWINPADNSRRKLIETVRPLRRQWLNGPMIAMLVAGIGTETAITGTEVAIVALLEHHAQIDKLWIVLAVWVVYSAIGGLVYGSLNRRVSPLVLLAVMGAATVPLGLMNQWWLVALCILPAGLMIAPTLAASVEKVSRFVPVSVRGEALGMHGSFIILGMALGGVLVGWTVDTIGPQWGFAVAGAGALVTATLAAVLMRLGRGTRAKAEPEPESQPATATACGTEREATVRWSSGQ